MSSQGAQAHTETGLGCVGSVSLETVNPLSWMVGERLTERDDRTELHSQWKRKEGRQQITVFDVTEQTSLIRCRSPVGRKRYFGTTTTWARRLCEQLAVSAEWHRKDEK